MSSEASSRPTKWESLRQHGSSSSSVRLQDRIADFEMLAALSPDEAVEQYGPEVFKRLGKTYVERLGKWGLCTAPEQAHATRGGVLRHWFPLEIIAWALVAAVPLLFGSTLAWSVAAAFVIAAPFLIRWGYRVELKNRLVGAIRNRCCPDCGYHLHTLPAIDPQVLGYDVGPSRCSECGAAWPLVPSPVDPEPSVLHGQNGEAEIVIH